MMQFVMHPGMVYEYPLWSVALLLIGQAAETTIPAVVWVVTLVGAGLTIAFSSFLGVPNLGMHLAMSAMLAISGALVLVLIIALSNPFRGDFRVSTLPFDRILAQIQASPVTDQ